MPCFLLPAYDEKVAERNSDVAKIAANLAVCLDDNDVIERDGDVCSRFDYVWWCGDLNYRVDLSRNETQAMLEKADYMVRNLQGSVQTDRQGLLSIRIATPLHLHYTLQIWKNSSEN